VLVALPLLGRTLMPLAQLAKFLMFGGGFLLLAGAVLYLGSRIFPSGLPGDISYSRGNFSFYFPIVTCIMLSVILTVVLNVISRLFR
jgi:hypothetical protein